MLRLIVIGAIIAATPAAAVALEAPQWNVSALQRSPHVLPSDQAKASGLEALFLDGLTYRGRPTRFFAYVGMPAAQPKPVPAVVLVHGGGGTAFEAWVRQWNAKGFAAISIDTEGHLPDRVRDPKPGDPGWRSIDSLGREWVGQPERPTGGFVDPALPMDEQWLYHAVADTLLAVSHLISRPEVDAANIGVVGISMGSIVCSIAGAIDSRVAFVIPQYIGGNNQLGNVWLAKIRENPEVMPWDPAVFYRGAPGRAQWLWVNGDNDKYGSPVMTTESKRNTAPRSRLCLLPSLGHGHIWGESGPNAVREIYAFAESVTRGAPPLAEILGAARDGLGVTVRWRSVVPVIRADIVHTAHVPTVEIAGETRHDFAATKYTVLATDIPPRTATSDGAHEALFQLPTGTEAFYINLVDARGLSVSTDFIHFASRTGATQPTGPRQ